MKIKILLLFQLVTFDLWSGPALADASRLFFTPSPLTDELSQPAVHQILQDSRGYIWLATQEGLNRFDGRENRIFRSDVTLPGTISVSYVQGMVEDEDGQLWIATAGGGLNKYLPRDESFLSIRTATDPAVSPLSDRIWTIKRGLANKIWVGYKEGGFSVFYPKEGVFKHYASQLHEVINESAVTDILEDLDGTVWITTDGGGLLRLDPTLDVVTRVGDSVAFRFPTNRFSDLHRDREGTLWLVSFNHGIFRLDTDDGVSLLPTLQQEKQFGISAKTPLEINRIFEDSDGGILFSTNSGVAVFLPEDDTIRLYTVENSNLTHNRVLSIFEDRTGLYWIGTYHGVNNGFRSPFRVVNQEAGLTEHTVLSIAKSSEGTEWIGTWGGLHRISPNSQPENLSLSPGYDLSEPPATALLAEGEHLWIGTFASGLDYFNSDTGTVKKFRHLVDDPSSLSSDKVTSVYRDSFGNLWVGTFRGGLNMMKRGQDSFVRFQNISKDPSSLSNDTIYAIYQERSGDLWVGTDQGLNRFNYETGTFNRYTHVTGELSTLSGDAIYSIYEDEKSRLWIGTEGGGLNMWEPVERKSSVGKFEHFQQNIELPSSSVYAIQGDSRGNIWFSTSGGITKFNFDEDKYKHFTSREGLQANDFSLSASYKDQTGRIYFGGSQGFNSFYPDEITDNLLKPPVALTRVSILNEQVWFDRPYDEMEVLELQHSQNMVSFEFAALDYNSPKKNQYRYQMVGLNKSWVDLGNKNTVDFTSLAQGEYFFRVQASNADGVWNEEGFSLQIRVHPPWYLSWVAFFFYISAALLVVLFWIQRQKLKEQAQLVYQAQLESDVRSRTQDLRTANEKLQSAVDEIGMARQEAVEANQAKSEFLAALSHEIRTPMHGVLGMTDLLIHSGLGERQAGFAQSAYGSATELLGLIDNILDFSKIEAGKLQLEETTLDLREVLENLCYLYGEMAQAKNIDLNLVFQPHIQRQLYGDPVRLRQVLQNLLSNSIKFTKHGSVNVYVEEIGRDSKSIRLKITVEDTGIGMDSDALNRIFEAFSQADTSTTRQYGGTGLGLSIAKQLIELMDGKLDVESEPDVGTRMSVELSFAESPIFTEKLQTIHFDGYHAEICAASKHTRAMLSSQMDQLSVPVSVCAGVEQLADRADSNRLVLIDVSSLGDQPSIEHVQGLLDDVNTVVLLVAPLSLEGIPEELSHVPHTTKPCRTPQLLSDFLTAVTAEVVEVKKVERPVLQFNQRVLVVEDMTANQAIARAMLESFGCSIELAINGSVALDAYQHGQYDIILMDCQMPVMDGFEATRHIRQLEAKQPRVQRIPIIAVTAGKTEVEKNRCYSAGMDRILFKPYSTEELNSTLALYFEPMGVMKASTSLAEVPKVGISELIDFKALDNIRNIDRQNGNKLLLKVFENFQADVETKVEELRAGTTDAKALGAGAHAIKSMSLNIGAKALSEYCRSREKAWKENEIADAEREVEVLYGHYLDAANALDPIVRGETIDQSVASVEK